MPWLQSLDGTTCAVPLKGGFKEAFFTAKALWKGGRQPKGTSPVILPMEARVTKAKPRRVEKPAIRGMREAGFSLAVNDPQPMAEVARFWRTAAQSATIGMFIILLVVALSLARPLLLAQFDGGHSGIVNARLEIDDHGHGGGFAALEGDRADCRLGLDSGA